MDILIPYVDCDDAKWQDVFLAAKHLPTFPPRVRDVMIKPFHRRFASYGLFKYWWRALEANFHDEFTVHLLLMQESQFPSFLKRDDKRIAVHFHNEFIPRGKRPCFDSSTIELCAIHSLNLSPVFLLANDDMYFNAPCCADDFCEGETPLTKIAVKEKYGHNLFQLALENGRRLVEVDAGKPCPAFAWHHLIQAYQERYVKQFLQKHWAFIEKRLGRFRHERDMNHLMLMMAQNLNGVSKDSERYPSRGYFECPDLHRIATKALLEPKVICLNDTNATGIHAARAYLEMRYPNKCSLEL